MSLRLTVNMIKPNLIPFKPLNIPKLVLRTNNNYWIRNKQELQSRNNNQKNHRKSSKKTKTFEKFSNFLFSVLGIGSYMLMDYLGLVRKLGLPSCFAINVPAHREEFNFIAEIAEESQRSVVFVEVHDTEQFNIVKINPQTVSTGSGFVVGSNGLVLTAAHLVLRALSQNSTHFIVVKLYDGKQFRADIEHIDRQTDLATLRIPYNDIPRLKLSPSSATKPGEFVLALGSPLALANTIALGVVSGYRKTHDLHLQDQTDYIQTDAAIQNGNAGGPLVNLEGNVIGINSINIIPGVSYAIPIDLVWKFLEECRSGKRKPSKRENPAEYRYIGVRMLSLNHEINQTLKQANFNISPMVNGGVFLHFVEPKSPAEEAGLKPGDIITEVNGVKVINTKNIYDFLDKQENRIMDLTVYRGEARIKAYVKPIEGRVEKDGTKK